jgi:hypothetical protein
MSEKYPLETIDTGNRTCPNCQGTTFEKCSCNSTEGRAELDGYRFRCKGCGWKGFSLQLAPKPADEITPAGLPALLAASHSWAQSTFQGSGAPQLTSGKPYGKA